MITIRGEGDFDGDGVLEKSLYDGSLTVPGDIDSSTGLVVDTRADEGGAVGDVLREDLDNDGVIDDDVVVVEAYGRSNRVSIARTTGLTENEIEMATADLAQLTIS